MLAKQQEKSCSLHKVQPQVRLRYPEGKPGLRYWRPSLRAYSGYREGQKIDPSEPRHNTNPILLRC